MAYSDWTEKQFLALTGGVAALVVLLMGGVLGMYYKSYSETGVQIEKLRVEVNKLEKEAAKHDDRQKLLEEMTRLAVDDVKRLPDEERIEEVMTQVSEQSRNARVAISQFEAIRQASSARAKRPTRGQSYEPVKMRIECTGAFHDLGHFINSLESKMERIVAITAFQLDANRDGLVPKQPQLKVKIEFEAYRYQ